MPSGSWAVNANGTWSTAANWTGSTIANGATFTATFSLNITGNRTVTLDTSRSIGTMTSDDTVSSNYWIFAASGGSILTLDNGGSKPVISHAKGTITGAAVIMAQYNLNLDGTNGFDKQGTGNVLISGAKSVAGTVTVTDGQLALGNLLQANGAPAATGNTLPSITAYTLSATTSSLVVASNTSFTFPSTVSGSGNFLYRSSGAGAVLTCPVGTLSGLSNASATYGAGIYLISALSNQLDVNDYAAKTIYWYDSNTAAAFGAIRYMGSSNLTTSTDIYLYMDNTVIAGHEARFTNPGSGRLIVTGTVNRVGLGGTITFILGGTNDLENEISGVISNAVGGLAIEKENVGRWILSGTNTYTGANTLTAGTLNIRNGSGLGASGATTATTLTAGTLQVQGGITLNKASSAWALNGSTIENVSGDNTITAASWTIATAQTVLVTAGTLTVTNAIAGTSARTLTKTGTGTLKLTSTTSGYLGTVTVSAGTLACQSIANVAVACSLGTQALAQAGISMAGGTTLAHVGTTASSTDRNITCTGAATENCVLDSSGTGSGAITYASGGTLTFNVSGAHTLILSGTNAADNTFARTIADASGGGAVSVSKQGSNTWVLTGSFTNSGGFSCNAGTLNFGATNRTLTGGLTVSAGTVSITSPATIDAPTTLNGGTVTAVLSGGTTITVSASAIPGAPATLQPNDATNGSNTFTGAVGVSGCVDLVTPAGLDVSPAGRGRVLGTSNTVTVNSGGILRTKSGTSQAGRARYYNLTLGNGSQVQIGAAA